MKSYFSADRPVLVVMDLGFFVQSELTPRFVELVQAPLSHPGMLWMTLPLLISTFLMTFYFGRYKEEDMGWNSAFANSLVLIFVSLDSIRFLLDNSSVLSDNLVKAFSVLFIVGYGLLLAFADFFHKLPRKLAFIISSPATVNILAYLNLAVIYTSIPLDAVTIISGVVLFAILFACFSIIRWVTPEA